MPHLAVSVSVSVSGHGFGHVAQSAPVMNRLHERMRLRVRSIAVCGCQKKEGNFTEVLEEICNAPRPKPVIPERAGQAADWITERL